MAKSQGLTPDRKRVRELEKFYSIMANRIQRELLAFDAANYTELKAISLQNEVNRMVKDMNIFAVKWSDAATPEAYKQAEQIATVALDILGKKPDPLFKKNVHKQSIEEAADKTIEDLMAANNSIKINVNLYIYLMKRANDAIMSVRFWDLRDEEVISGLLDETIQSGGSRTDLQRLIRIHFDRDVREKKFININGRNYNLTKYAENVARTRLRTVQTRGVLNTCQQYDNDLVEVSDHGSEFVDQCLDYEGNTYSIGGKTPGYEVLDIWPPFHPQCEHSIMPTSILAQEARKHLPASSVLGG